MAGTGWRNTVYTNLESDEVADYVKVAQKDLQDMKINVQRLSTGDLAARLIAESGNSRNDVIWALSLTNMLDPRILALTENYIPKGFERIPAQFKEAQGKWFAVTGYMAALCVNLDRLKQKNLPVPTGWKDLTNPIYKGEIVMPNPESSGTGFLQSCRSSRAWAPIPDGSAEGTRQERGTVPEVRLGALQDGQQGGVRHRSIACRSSDQDGQGRLPGEDGDPGGGCRL